MKTPKSGLNENQKGILRVDWEKNAIKFGPFSDPQNDPPRDPQNPASQGDPPGMNFNRIYRFYRFIHKKPIEQAIFDLFI